MAAAATGNTSGRTVDMKLTPTQNRALRGLVAAARMRVSPLVELRSPKLLGRGHGVTTVMRAAAKELGVPLLGISTALDGTCTEKEFPGMMDLEPLRSIRAAALASLDQHGVAFIDDLDLCVCPRHLKRSRTLVGEIKNAGQMWNWDVLTQPALLLKTLADEAAARGLTIVYASMEDNFQAFLQEPLSVFLGEPTQADYTTILQNRLGDEVACKINMADLCALHSQLAPTELLTAVSRAMLKKATASSESEGQQGANFDCSKCVPDSTELLASVRETLMSASAVRGEEVEPVELSKYPGLGNIMEELEKNVLFPLENPEFAAELGLTPKRGVLIHGEPGTGKTTVGRWLAHRLQGKFFRVGEMMVHSDIIKVFAAAQAAAPAVVFIDDADIVIGGWRPIDGGRGSDIFRFLLGQMDGLTSRGERQKQNGDVIVVLTGQNVQWMAKMLLRSGRIELWLKTKIPEPKVKREVLKKYVGEDPGAMKLLGDENGALPDVRQASQAGDQYCAADLRRIVSDAKILAAWDRHKNAEDPEKMKKLMTGSEYLEQAAKNVTDMQKDVDALTRSMYG